jgi:hypothetical protein
MYVPEMLEQDDEPPPRIGYAGLQGLTVDANGQIAYDFDGVIHARGLTLDAGAIVNPPDVSRATWKRPSDGQTVADLWASDHGATHELDIAAKAPADRQFARVFVEAETATKSGFIGVATDDLAGTTISLDVGGVFTLLDYAGNSGFLQLRAAANIRLQGPYSVLVPAIAAGAFATVFDNQADVTGLTGPTAVFGTGRVAAGNQRISLHGHNFPGGPGLNLLFYNPTAAASVANIPFVYCVVSVV